MESKNRRSLCDRWECENPEYAFLVTSDKSTTFLRVHLHLKEIFRSPVFRFVYPEKLRFLLNDFRSLVKSIEFEWDVLYGVAERNFTKKVCTSANFLGIEECTERYLINVPFTHKIKSATFKICFDRFKPLYVDKMAYKIMNMSEIDYDGSRIIADFECPEEFLVIGYHKNI